jgi:hypothetical protein
MAKVQSRDWLLSVSTSRTLFLLKSRAGTANYVKRSQEPDLVEDPGHLFKLPLYSGPAPNSPLALLRINAST